MAIAGFKKIDATRYDFRKGAYALVKADGGWEGYTLNANGELADKVCGLRAQALAADAIVEHWGAMGGPAAPAPEASPAPCAADEAAPAPCEPADEAVPAPCGPAEPCKPKAPKVKPRSRVDTTIDAMRRPEGVTVAELVELFDAEFGAGTGKRSTASQAVFKCPKARGLAAQVTKDKVEDRGLVYRLPAAPAS